MLYQKPLLCSTFNDRLGVQPPQPEQLSSCIKLLGDSCHFSLLHIFSDAELSIIQRLSRFLHLSPDIIEQLINEDRQKLEQWSKQLHLPVDEIAIIQGEPGQQITEYAAANGQDLLVLSASPLHSRHEQLIRSLCCQLKNATPDLLLCSTHHCSQSQPRFLFATDLHEESLPLLQKAADLAESSGAELHLLHAIDLIKELQISDELLNQLDRVQNQLFDEARLKFNKQLEKLGLRPNSIWLKKGNPVNEINKLCEKLEIDLLIVGITHKPDYLLKIASVNPEQLLSEQRHLLLLNPNWK